VHEPQVDVVGREGGEAPLERPSLSARVAGLQLGGDEELLPGDPAVADGLADVGLVPVHRGRVDEPVADVERVANGAVALAPGHLPRAEADERHGRTAAQRD
jgi:hypothetical protein